MKEEIKDRSKALKAELLREALPRLENYRTVRGKIGYLGSQEASLSDLHIKLKVLESVESSSKQKRSATELKLKFMEHATGPNPNPNPNPNPRGIFTKVDVEKLIAALAIRAGSENIEAALVEVWYGTSRAGKCP